MREPDEVHVAIVVVTCAEIVPMSRLSRTALSSRPKATARVNFGTAETVRVRNRITITVLRCLRRYLRTGTRRRTSSLQFWTRIIWVSGGAIGTGTGCIIRKR